MHCPRLRAAGRPVVAGAVVAMREGVVLQGEQGHIAGQVQLYPGDRVSRLTGGEPAVLPFPLPLSTACHHIPGPPL